MTCDKNNNTQNCIDGVFSRAWWKVCGGWVSNFVLGEWVVKVVKNERFVSPSLRHFWLV